MKYYTWYDEDLNMWYAVDQNEKCHGGWYSEQAADEWIDYNTNFIED